MPKPDRSNEARGDLVVDTNVLVHASRPGEVSWQSISIEFCERLLACKASMLIDFDEQANRSLLWAEYEKHLKLGDLGYQVLVKLGSEQRIARCDLHVPSNVHREIKKFIKGSKPRDRTVLKLATKTTTRQLVSHDYEDFQPRKRKDIKSELGIYVVTAAECKLP